MAPRAWVVSDELWESSSRCCQAASGAFATREGGACPTASAFRGSSKTGPSPVDRGRPGSKHHLLVDATGVPLAVSLTGGNRTDITQLIRLVDAVPPIAGRPGGPRRRPRVLVADRGYDHDAYRRQLRRRGIRPQIARRQTAHGSGLGRVRWPVERSLSWLHQFRRLLVQL